MMDQVKAQCASSLLLERRKSETDLYYFFQQAWESIEGTTPLIKGRHLEVICEHLMEVIKGNIKNLLVNVPPRCSKSNLVSVILPAFIWATNPGEQLLYASYSMELAREHSLKCRRLIESPWYQECWGHVYQLSSDQNTKHYFQNNKLGYRKAVSSGSAVLGSGGNILIADDINSSFDIHSKTKRDATLSWWKTVWSNRLNNRQTGRRIVISQRLHQQDISGFLLENDKENWVHLCLPLEYEPERKCKTIILPSTKKKPFEDWRAVKGEMLWDGISYLDSRRLKKELGSSGYATLYQQSPRAEEGNLIKRNWFGRWREDKLPPFSMYIQSWDLALSDKETSSYSACTSWGVFAHERRGDCLMLLSLWRDRADYPVLLKRMKLLYTDYRQNSLMPRSIPQIRNHKVDLVLVEEKASAYFALNEIRRSGLPASGFNPTPYGDKMQRVQRVSALIESGKVFIVDNKKFEIEHTSGEELIEHCIMFPNSDSRDVVDTMTQVILRLRDNGALSHSLDQEMDFNIPYEEERRF